MRSLAQGGFQYEAEVHLMERPSTTFEKSFHFWRNLLGGLMCEFLNKNNNKQFRGSTLENKGSGNVPCGKGDELVGVAETSEDYSV